MKNSLTLSLIVVMVSIFPSSLGAASAEDESLRAKVIALEGRLNELQKQVDANREILAALARIEANTASIARIMQAPVSIKADAAIPVSIRTENPVTLELLGNLYDQQLRTAQIVYMESFRKAVNDGAQPVIEKVHDHNMAGAKGSIVDDKRKVKFQFFWNIIGLYPK